MKEKDFLLMNSTTKDGMFYHEFIAAATPDNARELRKICDKFNKPYRVARQALSEAELRNKVSNAPSVEQKQQFIIEQLKKHRL
jgi:DNA replication protein DnaD